MGSSQSSEPVNTADNNNNNNNNTTARDDGDPKQDNNTVMVFQKARSQVSKDNNKLSGMDLVNHKCRRRKRVYDKCVAAHYKNFLGGKSLDQEEACGEKYEAYRNCTLKGIKKEIWDKEGLPPPKEGSFLSELDDDDEDDE
jgi:hypothetical protein